MRATNDRPKRLMWIVNHKTLLAAEVPIFRQLGYEVFIPKHIPDDPSYRSGAVTYDYDASLTIGAASLTILNNHHFYGSVGRHTAWSSTLTKILNDEFDVIVVSLSAFYSPFLEAVRKFDGLVCVRVFGLTYPNKYIDLLAWLRIGHVTRDIVKRGNKYAFTQGYCNIAEIEPPDLVKNAHTVTVAIPDSFFENQGKWVGKGSHLLFVCPGIEATGYYRSIYDGIKRDFGDLPHQIFGRQVIELNDPSILTFLSDEELIQLYANAPAFLYTSTEPRHVHYSPIEAMIVGTPVLYLRGSLCDILSGEKHLLASCADLSEMRSMGIRLLNGDRALADQIRHEQFKIVDAFRVDLAKKQWSALLSRS